MDVSKHKSNMQSICNPHVTVQAFSNYFANLSIGIANDPEYVAFRTGKRKVEAGKEVETTLKTLKLAYDEMRLSAISKTALRQARAMEAPTLSI